MTCNNITKLYLEHMGYFKHQRQFGKTCSCKLLKYDQIHLKCYMGFPAKMFKRLSSVL
ncbi:unnamed protein product [Callosobruchus maculatus]|nr:unnamed protein product [Callosobruchus maculatus]VEN56694.1 unnamed protein product [Callosobruchus maculatus]VEN61575.1 unnamed protein product [Callosobruchus maculatus]